MSFHLIEVQTTSQFTKMMPSFWASYTHPRKALMELVYPIKSASPTALTEAKEDCLQRRLSSWKSSSVEHYIQILDRENEDAVVASALWSFYDERNNPFVPISTGGENSGAGIYWWPEGSDIQKFTMKAMEQVEDLKMKRQKRPHLCIFPFR